MIIYELDLHSRVVSRKYVTDGIEYFALLIDEAVSRNLLWLEQNYFSQNQFLCIFPKGATFCFTESIKFQVSRIRSNANVFSKHFNLL